MFPRVENKITRVLDFFNNFRRALLIFFTASQTGWIANTIPGLPPNGRSSTFLCLSFVNARRSYARTEMIFFCARLKSDSARYGIEYAGKNGEDMETHHACGFSPGISSAACFFNDSLIERRSSSISTLAS